MRKINRMSGSTWLVALSLLFGTIGLRYLDPPLILGARLAVFDTYQTIVPRVYGAAPVRVVDIDDESLTEFGQWPWPRTLIAQLVDELNGLGVASIAFDMVFAEPDRTSPKRYLSEFSINNTPLENLLSELPDHDEIFAKAIANAPVVLGIARSPIITSKVPLLKTGFAFGGADPIDLVSDYGGSITNLNLLEQSAKGQGSLAIGSAEGGIVRRIPMLQRFGDQLFPTLIAEALRVAQGASTIVTRASDASGNFQIGNAIGLESMRIGNLEIPLTQDGHLWIHYTEENSERSVSVKDILLSNNRGKLAERLQGHIVLVGTSATGLKDLRATPFTAFESGVVIHAQALEQIILKQFLQRPDWADGLEIITLLVIGLLLIFLLSRVGAVWSGVAGVTTVLATIGSSWIAFTSYQLLIDPVYTVLAVLLIYVLTTMLAHVRTERSRDYIRKAFSSYLSPALVEQLSEDPSMLKLDGESKCMTFIFTDIAGFTELTEKTEPELLVAVLNEYLDGACQIITEGGGTIDKMIGDAIVSIFNAPIDQVDHAQRAVETAFLLDKFFTDFVARKKLQGIDMGITRIGINTGVATIGNFGGAQRFDYTVIGDAVNTAARIESANKYLGTRICVSGETMDQCSGLYFRPIASLVLKGKSLSVNVFEPIAEEVYKSPYIQSYIDFYKRIENNEASDVAELIAIQKHLPTDPVINFHLQRMSAGENGVHIVMDKK